MLMSHLGQQVWSNWVLLVVLDAPNVVWRIPNLSLTQPVARLSTSSCII